MIYEIYENKQKSFGFESLLQGVFEELVYLFSELWQEEGPEMANNLYSSELVPIHELEPYIDYSGSHEIKIEEEEDYPISERYLIHVISFVYSLRFIRGIYLNGETDRAWAALISTAYWINKRVNELEKLTNKEPYLSNSSEAAKRFLSTIGFKGAIKKHELARELKDWALQQAATMRGSDIEISRALVQQLPPHLEAASKDPQRLIYSTLLHQRNSKN